MVLSICAGPGSGKSILASQFAKEASFPCATIDFKMLGSDQVVLLKALAKAFESIWPDLFDTSPSLQKGLVSPATTLEKMLDRLILQGGRAGLLIMDNCHLLADMSGSKEMISMLFGRLPSFISVVLLSRQRVCFKEFPALKIQGRVLELFEGQLYFSREEVESYLFRVLPNASDKVADEVFKATGGWPAATALLCLELRSNPLNSGPCFNMPEDLLNYLDSEVFSHMGPCEKKVLCIALLLEPFDLEIMKELLSSEQLGKFLALLNASFFIEKAAIGSHGDTFRLSAMLKEFLKRHIGPILGEEGRRHIHQMAAKHFERRGDISRAVWHYNCIAAWEGSIRLIQENALKWLEKSLAKEVLGWMEPLPETVFLDVPRLFFLKGQAQLYLGLIHEAMESLEKAFKYLKTGSKVYMEAGCRLCEALLLNAKARKARDMARSISRRARFFSRYRAEAMLFEAIALHQLGELEECEGLWKQVERIANSRFLPLDESSRCYLKAPKAVFYHLDRGDFVQGESLLDHCISIFRRKDPRKRLGWAMIFKGVVKLELFKAREALQWFREAEAVASTSNRSAHGVSLGFLAYVHAQLGLVKQGRKWLERAYEARLKEPTRWVEVLSLLASACLSTGRDDTETAIKEAYHLAVHGNIFFLAALTAFTAFAIRRRLGHMGLVKRLLEDCMERCRRLSILHREIRCLLYLAELERETEGSSVEGFVQRALRLMRQSGHGFLLTCDPLIPCLETALFSLSKGYEWDYVMELMPGFGYRGCKGLEEIFNHASLHEKMLICNHWKRMGYREAMVHMKQAMRVQPDETARACLGQMLESLSGLPPEPLHIKMFGGFELKKGSKPIVQGVWKRKAAKILFKFLCMNHGKVFTQEQLLEVLWPDSDPQKGRNWLWNAVTMIRSILEPELGARARSNYLICMDKSYRLVLPPGSTVDIDSFQKEAKEGMEAFGKEDLASACFHFERAVSMYEDDLLPEHRYEDWCAPERERLRLLFLQVLKKLSWIYKDRRDFDKAILLMHLDIRAEPWDEDAYYNLMELHILNGDELKALKIYEQCRKQLKEEFGVEPNKRLQGLYERLVTRRSM